MSDHELTEGAVYHTMRSWMTKHPEFLNAAVTGITDGVKQAIDDVYALRSKTDMAFRVALSMIDNKRLLKDQNFIKTVVDGMPLTGRSEIEAEFVRRHCTPPSKPEVEG